MIKTLIRQLGFIGGAIFICGVSVQPLYATEAKDRSALIIGIGHYAGPASDLLGVPADVEMAKTMAAAMGVSEGNITVLRDQEATKKNILQSLQSFSKKASDGGRVFIYFSGHGTRYLNPFINSCVEGLLSYDYETITNEEMAQATKSLINSVDKSIFIIDACHSSGVLSATKNRSLVKSLNLTPKFASKDKDGELVCTPINYKTRGLFDEAKTLGAIQENIVYIASARPDEVSWDEAGKGGIATQSLKDCLLGDAKDLDGSGAVSLEEIQKCAQAGMDKRMPGPHQIASHITIRGNRNLIPVRNNSDTGAEGDKLLSNGKPTKEGVANLNKPPASADDRAGNTSISSIATLKDIELQSNPARSIEVKIAKSSLRINQDYLNLQVKSSHDGYVYLVLLGSDQKSFYILFPNRMAGDNFIKAGQTISIPGDTWRIKAAGPAGVDNILVMVSDAPRDLTDSKMLTIDQNSPFVYAVNNLAGRAALINYMTGKTVSSSSERYSAKLIKVSEKL